MTQWIQPMPTKFTHPATISPIFPLICHGAYMSYLNAQYGPLYDIQLEASFPLLLENCSQMEEFD